MAIVAQRFVERLGVVRIKYTNDDPTKAVPEPVDLFEMQGDIRIHCCCEVHSHKLDQSVGCL